MILSRWIMVEGAPHTAGRDQQINLLYLEVPPAPVYKGARGRRPAKEEGAPRGVLLPPAVGFPPFHVVGVGVKVREERREGRRGRSPSP